MDFKDYRNTAKKPGENEQTGRPVGKLSGRQYHHYIEEQIQEAVARGEFDNLAGTGKPLDLTDDHLAGDKTSAYRLLKQNGYAPPEIELLKEIRRENERIEQQMNRLRSQARDLRALRSSLPWRETRLQRVRREGRDQLRREAAQLEPQDSDLQLERSRHHAYDISGCRKKDAAVSRYLSPAA